MTEKKILVVSGDPILLRLLRDNFPAKGYQVTSTKDTGQELRAVVDRVLPDLVILDIVMPQLEGIEVCLRLRQWSQVPIMMLSTWGARKGTVRGLDLSADSYLTEPFSIAELMERIEETLSWEHAPEKPSPNLAEHDSGRLRTVYYSY